MNNQLNESEHLSTSRFQVKFSTEKLKHKTYCKENISRETISQELTQEPVSDVDFNKIFEELKKCSGYILFLGQPKVGKSVLVKKFARFVYRKDYFDFIFFCNLRHQGCNVEVDLFDFLLTQKHFPWMKNECKRDMVLTKILESKNVLLIFDDFDGYKFNRTSESTPGVSYFDKKKHEVFLMNILRGDLLRDWKKIIVSRPFQLNKIYDVQKPKLVLNVLGFDSQSLKQILEIQKISWIFDFPQISCDLRSFCFVPKVFNLLAETIQQYPELDTSTTDIFSILFLNFFEQLNSDYNNTMSLKILAEFSWKQYSENRLQMCFEAKQSPGLTDNYLNCFFISIPGSSWIGFQDYGYRFHFSHILMQEFLLAMRVIMLPNNEFKKFIHSVIDNECFFMVVRFLFGFYNVRSGIRLYLEKEFSQSIANFEQNKKYLKTLIKEKKNNYHLSNSSNHKLHQRYQTFETEMN